MEQSRERSSAPLRIGVIAIEKGAFGSPSITIANFTIYSNILPIRLGYMIPAIESNPWSDLFGEIVSCLSSKSSFNLFHYQVDRGGSPRSVVYNTLDCDILVNKFELWPRYYAYFRVRYEHLYPSSSLVFFLWHYVNHEGWYAIKQRNQIKLVDRVI